MLKKTLALLLTAVMVITVGACGGSKPQKTEDASTTDPAIAEKTTEAPTEKPTDVARGGDAGAEEKETTEFVVEEANIKIVYNSDWTREEENAYNEEKGKRNVLWLKHESGAVFTVDLHDKYTLEDEAYFESIGNLELLLLEGEKTAKEAVDLNGVSAECIEVFAPGGLNMKQNNWYFLPTESPYTMCEILISGKSPEAVQDFANVMIFPLGE